MPTDLSSITNLGTAGFSIFVLWQTSKMFIKNMESERLAFRKEMEIERESSRAVEKEVRTSIMKQLSDNTMALSRVIKFLEK